MDSQENRDQKLRNALKPLLTDRFLDVLIEAACVVGDYCAFDLVTDFVNECIEISGRDKSCPIKPYVRGITIINGVSDEMADEERNDILAKLRAMKCKS